MISKKLVQDVRKKIISDMTNSGHQKEYAKWCANTATKDCDIRILKRQKGSVVPFK